MINKCMIVLLLLFALSACTKDDMRFSTPEKTYRLWFETALRGDISGNMECISESSRRMMDTQMNQMDQFAARLNANMQTFKSYSVTDQKMKGDRAVVLLKDADGDIIAIPLMRENDAWKIDLVAFFGGSS